MCSACVIHCVVVYGMCVSVVCCLSVFHYLCYMMFWVLQGFVCLCVMYCVVLYDLFVVCCVCVWVCACLG